MQWDRRAFIKLAVGGVLGVHASPLVWKLMDDSTIWTQNWSWVPVPEDGEVAFANTVSPQTGNAVQTRLVLGRVDGTRAIRVEGNPDHPLGKGGVIPEDSSALQLLYNDDIRVKTPLMRDKATGRIVPLSWPEALDLLAGNLAELGKKGKPEGLMALGHDPDSTTGQILMSLMAALGSPNVAFTPDARETLALAGLVMMGQTELGFDWPTPTSWSPSAPPCWRASATRWPPARPLPPGGAIPRTPASWPRWSRAPRLPPARRTCGWPAARAPRARWPWPCAPS